MGGETVEVFFVGGNADAFERVVELHGFEGHAPGESSAVVFLGQCHRHAKMRHAGVVIDDALVWHDLDERALIGVIRAVWAMEGENPLAADAEVERLEGAGEAFRTKPERELLGIAEGFKHALA